MFERYTESARRAIFYARAVTFLNDAPAIDSSQLLYGLMWEADSRAQIFFGLREKFPLYCQRPYKAAHFTRVLKRRDMPLLTDDTKRILARTAMEADGMGDYWIETEHLLVGILAEPESTAAQHLAKAGITLEDARRLVIENKPSRPPYGPEVRLGETPSPLERLVFRYRMWRYGRKKPRRG
jgi:ATP-dependent Clp protease ATP-binding subunit ClpA